MLRAERTAKKAKRLVTTPTLITRTSISALNLSFIVSYPAEHESKMSTRFILNSLHRTENKLPQCLVIKHKNKIIVLQKM